MRRIAAALPAKAGRAGNGARWRVRKGGDPVVSACSCCRLDACLPRPIRLGRGRCPQRRKGRSPGGAETRSDESRMLSYVSALAVVWGGCRPRLCFFAKRYLGLAGRGLPPPSRGRPRAGGPRLCLCRSCCRFGVGLGGLDSVRPTLPPRKGAGLRWADGIFSSAHLHPFSYTCMGVKLGE